MRTPLDTRDALELVRIARAAIREHLISGNLPPGAPHRAVLTTPARAAVRLCRDGRLAALAAEIDQPEALYLAVERLAVRAAELARVQLEEVDALIIEVAPLGTPRPLASPEAVGATEGVAVTRGPRRGVALPADAADPVARVAAACTRAGLGPDDWQRPDTTLVVFTAA